MSLKGEVTRHLLPALGTRLGNDPDFRAGRACLLPEADGAWLLWSEPTEAPPMLLSPGLAAAPGEYRPLRRLFCPTYQLFRITHPGTDRQASLGPLAELLARRALLGQSRTYAAQAVRARLHGPALRMRRLEQLRIAAREVIARTGALQLALTGHSYGTDTALQLALNPELEAGAGASDAVVGAEAPGSGDGAPGAAGAPGAEGAPIGARSALYPDPDHSTAMIPTTESSDVTNLLQRRRGSGASDAVVGAEAPGSGDGAPGAGAVSRLVLFSPHPPGYLIPIEALAALKTVPLELVTGPNDRTADGVSPEQRVALARALPPDVQVQVHWLDQFDHLAPVWETPTTDRWLQPLKKALQRE